MEKRIQEQTHQLKKMGWSLIALAAAISSANYFLPGNESNYWLSADGKQGFYVLSGLFSFLGLYCLGAIWRRNHFI